tara:strand:- start:2623 stop:3612 length:990 start_codon:yes stop_codon:yes gene_type:complete
MENNNKSIKDILFEMDKNDLSSTKYNNKTLKFVSQLTNKVNNIACLQFSIDFSELFKYFHNTEKQISILKDTYCGYYKNGELKIDFVCNVLSEFMYEKKIICCFSDFCDYTLDVEKGNNTCVTHSSLTILKPENNGIYYAYQFNPHGRYLLTEKYYTQYISRKRTKTYILNEILDVYVMKLFFSTMEKEMRRECNFDIKIRYNESENHNYYGINLQSGDEFGCCFIFPFILYYHLAVHMYDFNYLKNDKKKRTYRFPSFKHLLRENKFNEMINIIMSLYLKEFTYEVIDFYKEPEPELDYFYDMSEYLLEKKNNSYIKSISESMLELIY